MDNRSTREQIIDAADLLFYRHGYDHTSFADIAEAVDISRGNFYHHFKAKDDILQSVIESRLADSRRMLARWEADSDDPRARIESYIRILIAHWDDISYFGCPVGTLTSELGKLDHASQPGAIAVFTLFRDWLAEQFRALGRPDDADNLAMQVLAFSQGVATLASAFKDEAFMQSEVARMIDWLDTIAAPGKRH